MNPELLNINDKVQVFTPDKKGFVGVVTGFTDTGVYLLEDKDWKTRRTYPGAGHLPSEWFSFTANKFYAVSP